MLWRGGVESGNLTVPPSPSLASKDSGMPKTQNTSTAVRFHLDTHPMVPALPVRESVARVSAGQKQWPPPSWRRGWAVELNHSDLPPQWFPIQQGLEYQFVSCCELEYGDTQSLGNQSHKSGNYISPLITAVLLKHQYYIAFFIIIDLIIYTYIRTVRVPGQDSHSYRQLLLGSLR